MYEITEKIIKKYVVTCPEGEVTFEEEGIAHAFVQVHDAVKGTPQQVAAWCAIGSCPNCGGNQGNGDLDIEHLDGSEYQADCYVCGTRFYIVDGKSEVID